jgi:hypothetical protein
VVLGEEAGGGKELFGIPRAQTHRITLKPSLSFKPRFAPVPQNASENLKSNGNGTA